MVVLDTVSGTAGVLIAASFATTILGRYIGGFVYPFCVVACLFLLGHDLSFLLSAQAAVVTTLPIGLPDVGVHLRLDSLSAFFGVVVNLGGALAALYGIGYGHHDPHHSRVLPFFPIFLAAMNLVLLADDAFTFLVSWECMSLVSWALVVSNHREFANRKAGYVYLLMANFGGIALLFAFGVLVGSGGGYAFDSIRAVDKPTWMAGLAMLLALIGAGSKAGLVPLHVWLPLAHPAAPSNVSALMSGVMTKVAVYGFVRIVFDLLGTPDWWWSLVILALGGITCVMGVLYAIMQEDLKRLLAYSTVENIGIIFIGLGLSIAFKANGMDAMAALALTAGLLHVFNHSLFKSLLFFGAGAVLVGTGERNMDRLGGLIHRMPRTALVFLVGCVSISALPPLNGFVSEWLTFQAILLSPQLPWWGLKFLVPAVGGLLALSAALVAACFVKAYGVTFLGRPRSPEAERAVEVDLWSQSAMFILAALCLIVGVMPSFFIGALAPVTQSLVGGHVPLLGGFEWFSIVPNAASQSSYSGLIILVFTLATGTFTAWFIHAFASRRINRTAAWDCGFPDSSPMTEYTGSSFAQPIRRVFGTVLFRARDQVDMPKPGEVRAAVFKLSYLDYVWDYAYVPITRAVQFVSGKLDKFQYLSIRRYLMFAFFTLISLLIVVALWH